MRCRGFVEYLERRTAAEFERYKQLVHEATGAFQTLSDGRHSTHRLSVSLAPAEMARVRVRLVALQRSDLAELVAQLQAHEKRRLELVCATITSRYVLLTVHRRPRTSWRWRGRAGTGRSWEREGRKSFE